MSRLLVLLFALLLPFQFAWSAASAYCEHESSAGPSQHVGHHAHTHQGESKQDAGGKLAAHADCASCHAASAAVIASRSGLGSLGVSAAGVVPAILPAFSSALARAPDRPQWLRLV